MVGADQPTVESPPWTSIFLPKPKPVEPEPQPREAAQPRSAQATETVDTLVPVPPISDSVVARGPVVPIRCRCRRDRPSTSPRSEEHTSELQSLMRISYAVFCLNKKTTITI